MIAAAVVVLVALPYVRGHCTELTGGEILTVHVDGLAAGSARLFCYHDQAGKRLRFLLARGEDGKLRAAFDACQECYAFGKGYAVHGSSLICRVCGTRYPIDHMLEGKASCVPLALPVTQHGAAVQVKVSDVERGRWLF